MAVAANSFDAWLIRKLQALNTDEGVYGSYIRSILEGDEPEDEKTEALESILAGITVSGWHARARAALRLERAAADASSAGSEIAASSACSESTCLRLPYALLQRVLPVRTHISVGSSRGLTVLCRFRSLRAPTDRGSRDQKNYDKNEAHLDIVY
jgi:hypothetical protein